MILLFGGKNKNKENELSSKHFFFFFKNLLFHFQAQVSFLQK
jgi:hypothetical protein